MIDRFGRSPIEIGWFGIPGRPYGTRVHITLRGEPVCGIKMSRDMEFQFCSFTNLDYVECERCKNSHFATAMRNALAEYRALAQLPLIWKKREERVGCLMHKVGSKESA